MWRRLRRVGDAGGERGATLAVPSLGSHTGQRRLLSQTLGIHPMKETFIGHCQCAALNYRVCGTSTALFACHCTDCQRQSASAFAMALWVKDADVEILSGELKEWIRTMPSGRKMACRFCGICGTRVFHHVLGTDILSIKPGTLENTKHLKPCGHIWTGSKQEWVHIDKNVLQYTGNPENYDALISAWLAEPGHCIAD